MQQPVVLAYNLGPERAGRVRTLCIIQKLRLRPVRPEEYGEPQGALAGLLPPTGNPAPAETFDDELLVLCGFSEAALGAFLAGFRRAGIPPVALKAVLTPSNAGWDAVRLHQELCREHAAMTRPPEAGG